MDLPIDQQIFELIKKSGNILVVLPQVLTADALSSGLALRLFLTKLQKNVSLVSSGQLPENLKFLPGSESLQNQIGGGKSLVITVDTSIKHLEEISYQTAESRAQIYLKSQEEFFEPEDLSFSRERFRPDLVVTLQVESLNELGTIYERSADVFFETPKINIDNQPGNEYFGILNLVELTATSVAEILTELLQKYEEQLVDEDIATCLLAGIIANTRSFQHVQTTPKAFLKASELVSLGGRQQEIVKNIYQTKSLALLKLWGRALARMKTLDNKRAIYSVLNSTDFEKALASQAEILPALREFIDNVSGYQVLALIAQPQKAPSVILAAVHQQLPMDKFLEILGGQANVLDLTLGNYKLAEIIFGQETTEILEQRFLQALTVFS